MDTATERWNSLWAVNVSSRYHARRQAFFERWHRVSTGVSGILGSTAAANALAQGGVEITATAGFIVAAISAIDLVVATSQMAQKHFDLRKRFLVLEAKIQCSEDHPSVEEIHEWKRERLKIEGDEPPLFNGLNVLCEKEVRRAYGYEDRIPMTRWQRLTAHWFHWYDLAPDMPKSSEP